MPKPLVFWTLRSVRPTSPIHRAPIRDAAGETQRGRSGVESGGGVVLPNQLDTLFRFAQS
jgi:hypothetical protein